MKNKLHITTIIFATLLLILFAIGKNFEVFSFKTWLFIGFGWLTLFIMVENHYIRNDIEKIKHPKLTESTLKVYHNAILEIESLKKEMKKIIGGK